MSKKYDYCIFVGRFQSFHHNHKALVDSALEQAEKVIILLGSANRPRSIKNPFTTTERMLMIDSVYKNTPVQFDNRILFGTVNDYIYNNQRWAMEVQNKVDNIIEIDGKQPDDVKLCITGNKEDCTSWYIDLFPQWEYIEPTGLIHDLKHVHSTEIRKILFGMETNISSKKIKELVPLPVFKYLEEFKKTNEFLQLAGEFGYIQDYKKSWEKAPYAPTFVTVDSVVIQSGHILLIKRRSEPGKNLLALPGGFLNPNELIIDGALRELKEETKIKVPIPVLKGNIKEVKVYDAPDRSFRGRTITHCVHIQLPDYGDLPKIKAADDALSTKFYQLNYILDNPQLFFEDHWDIITDLVGC